MNNVIRSNAISCTVYEACSPQQHCRNGGSCDRLLKGYQCWCSNEFTGRRCESKQIPPLALVLALTLLNMSLGHSGTSH